MDLLSNISRTNRLLRPIEFLNSFLKHLDSTTKLYVNNWTLIIRLTQD